jgi:hypothetical protein
VFVRAHGLRGSCQVTFAGEARSPRSRISGWTTIPHMVLAIGEASDKCHRCTGLDYSSRRSPRRSGRIGRIPARRVHPSLRRCPRRSVRQRRAPCSRDSCPASSRVGERSSRLRSSHRESCRCYRLVGSPVPPRFRSSARCRFRPGRMDDHRNNRPPMRTSHRRLYTCRPARCNAELLADPAGRHRLWSPAHRNSSRAPTRRRRRNP